MAVLGGLQVNAVLLLSRQKIKLAEQTKKDSLEVIEN